ncbi:MAG TPA: biotin/lipoyl-binding protein, partial [Candidatus Eremiobacteraceae bacterium]|nr:biotin/lipoyl-binding protein [Candidatus Eremiobacteraceae bacterium]
MSSTPLTSPTNTAAAASEPAEVSLRKTLLEWFRALGPVARLTIAVLIVAALIALHYYTGRVTTDDAQVDAHITTIAPQVPGYVIQLLINDNTPVKEGDLLLQIDPREYEAEVEQAKAMLAVAEANANSAKLQIRLTRETTVNGTSSATAQKESDAADFSSSQAQLEQSATANLKLAEANVAAKKATNERAQSDKERYTPLLGTGDVSKFQYDSVDATARVSQSDLDAAQQQLAAAQQAVAIARANTRSAEARVTRSQSVFLETKAREQQIPISEATYKSAVAAVEHAKAVLQ